jgi:hypothetical protein
MHSDRLDRSTAYLMGPNMQPIPELVPTMSNQSTDDADADNNLCMYGRYLVSLDMRNVLSCNFSNLVSIA